MAEAPQSISPVISVLSEHHRRIEQILRELLDSHQADQDLLVYELFVELRVHSILEQQLFFPAVASLIAKDQVRRCGSDFYVMLALMLELEQIEPDNELFGKNLKTIAERFSQHVRDVELEIVPRVIDSQAIDVPALSRRLEERKRELHDKMRARMKPRNRDQSGFVPPMITKYTRCA